MIGFSITYLQRLKMKTDSIAIYVFLPTCFFLTSCGLKTSPKPDGCSEITYPQMYPKPVPGDDQEEKIHPEDEVPSPNPESPPSEEPVW